MAFRCERCGHRKWGYPFGAAAGRTVCHDCFFGEWALTPSAAPAWARLAELARRTEPDTGTPWRLVAQSDGSWTFRLTCSDPFRDLRSLPGPLRAH